MGQRGRMTECTAKIRTERGRGEVLSDRTRVAPEGSGEGHRRVVGANSGSQVEKQTSLLSEGYQTLGGI